MTTIAEDKGIPVILPEYYDGPPGLASENNVLKILVNSDDELLVESNPMNIDKMRDVIIEFVKNPNGESSKPRSPDKAIISLQNDVNTSYDMYVKIYAHIHEAYLAMRNEMAQIQFQSDYYKLAVSEKNIVLKKFPMKLSEADPFDFN